MNKIVSLRMTKETKLSFHAQKTLYKMIVVSSWYLGGEDIHIRKKLGTNAVHAST